jgi:hypothetical protein
MAEIKDQSFDPHRANDRSASNDSHGHGGFLHGPVAAPAMVSLAARLIR